jgi:hypothetical protein
MALLCRQWSSLQEQLNRRFAESGIRLEPVNAMFAEFLGQFTKDEMAVMGGGICSGRTTEDSHRESPDPISVDACGAQGSFLTWEHPREKTPDPRQWASRTVIYPMELAEIIIRWAKFYHGHVRNQFGRL